jgi:hypothetical protein
VSLFDALRDHAIAAIDVARAKASTGLIAGQMKDFAHYKYQAGILEGLRIAAQLVDKQHELLSQPPKKPAAKAPQSEES